MGGAKTEGEPQADSALSTGLGLGFDLVTLRSQSEPKPRLSHLTDYATQGPLFYHSNWM